MNDDIEGEVEMVPMSSAIPWAIVAGLIGMILGFLMAASGCPGIKP